MMDGDSHNDAPQNVLLEGPFKPAPARVGDPEPLDDYKLPIDHNDPLAWLNFWPV